MTNSARRSTGGLQETARLLAGHGRQGHAADRQGVRSRFRPEREQGGKTSAGNCPKGRAFGLTEAPRTPERVLTPLSLPASEVSVSLGTLASGLHHELKNPLTALSLHIQLLDERVRGLATAEPLDDLLSVLKTEVCRLNGVLEGFRSFASLQRLHLQPQDALAVLDEAVRLIGPQAANQDVEIIVSKPDEALPLVSLDSQKFQQAVLNLMINALEAMPDGGKLTLRSFLERGHFVVEVADTGAGIPPELARNLFKPYFSTKTQGTGMGLALTEKLIGQHGGQVDFESGTQGTTFRIILPLEPPRDEP